MVADETDLPQQAFDSRCPPQKPTTFLWVNHHDSKDPNYISSRRQQSFIKTRHHRLKKEMQLQKLKESLKPFPGSKPSFTGYQKFQDVEGETNENDRYAPVLLRGMRAGLVEAFHSLPRYTNENMDFYFHHCKTYIPHVIFPFSANSMSVCFFRTALGQPALIETVLLAGAQRLACSLNTADASTRQIQRIVQDTFQLRLRTLKSLQNLLHSSMCFSEETLLVIAVLMGVETAHADLESVDAHLVGIRYIIARLGGLEKITLQTLSIIYCCDAMQGIIRTSPPVFRLSQRWETWVRKNSTCLDDSPCKAPQSLGKRFFKALWFGDLPKDLRKIIKVFQKLISIHERMIEIDCRNMPAENECFHLMLHHLYSLPYRVPITPFDDVICISIRVYSTNRVWTLQSSPAQELLSRNLQQGVLKCYDQLQRIAPDLLFWSLFLGGLISKKPEVHDWFLTHLKAIAEQIGVHDWDQARTVLEGCLFVCRSSGEPARGLWESVFRFGGMEKSRTFQLVQ